MQAPQGESERIAEEIGEQIRRIHKASYGTEIFDFEILMSDDTVVMIGDVESTAAERTLLDAGHPDAVTGTREAYQQAIGPSFIAVVERATGRRVRSFLSSMCVDPLYMVELFRLEPVA